MIKPTVDLSIYSNKYEIKYSSPKKNASSTCYVMTNPF